MTINHQQPDIFTTVNHGRAPLYFRSCGRKLCDQEIGVRLDDIETAPINNQYTIHQISGSLHQLDQSHPSSRPVDVWVRCWVSPQLRTLPTLELLPSATLSCVKGFRHETISRCWLG
jgi:hypothetical protein